LLNNITKDKAILKKAMFLYDFSLDCQAGLLAIRWVAKK